ncbi:MAG: GMC family oxidoreductase [Proteobacteria bacterium]|nr:GMC family oxidoreductase [Pseudomonadota bacterium]
MFLDLHELDDGALIDSDLCIIGAGAAGITIALEFLDAGLNVFLVESGGLEFEEGTQALYTAESIGLPYGPLDSNRLRYFGGTTNHWGGMSGPFQKIDLEKRDWVEHSGWPISMEELDPFYLRAHEICQLGPYKYDLSEWESDKRKFLKLLPEKLEHKAWRFGPPTRFGKVYRSRLQSSEKIKILLHANATEIVTDWTASNVTGIRLATLDGRKATVRSRLYVLACGGVENARVLLISNNVDAGGVGNRHDMVGRFFMEHPHMQSGTILLTKLGDWYTAYEHFKWKGLSTWVGLGPSAKAQRRHKILNSSATLDLIRPDGQAAGGARVVLGPDDLGAHIANVIRDPDDDWQDSAPRGSEDVQRSEAGLRLYARTEQAPNPDSRVKLAGERDALGLNRVALDWRMTELDKHTVRVVARLIGEEIGRLGLGRFRFNEWLLDDSSTPPYYGWPGLAGGQHHMGTTRVGEDPKTSVVDPTCRVHGISNFYVAGSSVFPTSSYVNPTFNLVTLAVRLADHLKRQFA